MEGKINNMDKISSELLVEFDLDKNVNVSGLYYSQNKQLLQKSQQSIDKAMHTIIEMANTVDSTINSIKSKPKQIEIEFGLKFDDKVGVVISKFSSESSLNIKFMWSNNTDQDK